MSTPKVSFFALALIAGLSYATVQANASLKEKEEAIPKNCQLLREVTTGQTHIRKRIESILIGNNFNVDFAVPTGTRFVSFKATMLPENDATYNVEINLKYSDMSSSSAFRDSVAMKRGGTYSLPFVSPTDRQPFQINFNISGANNNAYTVFIMACK